MKRQMLSLFFDHVVLPASEMGLLDRIFDHVVLPAPEINRDKLVDRIFGYIAISIGA